MPTTLQMVSNSDLKCSWLIWNETLSTASYSNRFTCPLRCWVSPWLCGLTAKWKRRHRWSLMPYRTRGGFQYYFVGCSAAGVRGGLGLLRGLIRSLVSGQIEAFAPSFNFDYLVFQLKQLYLSDPLTFFPRSVQLWFAFWLFSLKFSPFIHLSFLPFLHFLHVFVLLCSPP